MAYYDDRDGDRYDDDDDYDDNDDDLAYNQRDYDYRGNRGFDRADEDLAYGRQSYEPRRERGFEQDNYDQRRHHEGPRNINRGEYYGGGQTFDRGPSWNYGPPPMAPAPRKKSLLIGINYIGSQHRLQGCHQDVENMREFLAYNGYPNDRNSQVILRDDRFTDPRGPFFPNGHNMLAAIQWLVSEPGTCNFLHYSGHGGQVPDRRGYRESGFEDTIVPVDFEQSGQIPSNVLHNYLVTRLPPNSTLFIIFDCCHSGSAAELPYVYRTDADGNVRMIDNVQAGLRLVGQASHLVQGGFSMQSLGEAESLLAGATSFFRSLTHKEEVDQYGLGAQEFAPEYRNEGPRNVWMYSGCRDDQTSADASIAGSHVGAMSWAFLESMRRFGPNQSYIQVLQNTRQILSGRYSQIPQLSVGYEQDLNYQIRI